MKLFVYRNYTAITNSEQRARYKKDFNMYYNQYIQYHQILDKVRARFTNLQNTLKEAPKDSLEYLVRYIEFIR